MKKGLCALLLGLVVAVGLGATRVFIAPGAVVVSVTPSENTTMYTPQSITTAVLATAILPPLANLKRADARPCLGPMSFLFVFEGSATSRMRPDGVSPTTTVGNLIPAAGSLNVKGWDVASRLRFIGTAAGNTVTASITCDDETLR